MIDKSSCQGIIGDSYGFLDKYDVPEAPRPLLSPAARASLRGLAASAITFGLWIGVMALATPMPLLAVADANVVAGTNQVELA